MKRAVPVFLIVLSLVGVVVLIVWSWRISERLKDLGGELIRMQNRLADVEATAAALDRRLFLFGQAVKQTQQVALNGDKDQFIALADTDQAVGWTDAAKAVVEKLAEKYPDDLDVKRALLSAYLQAQDYVRARKVVDKLLHDDPSSLATRTLYVRYLRKTKRWAEAREAAKALVRDFPASPEGYLHLALIQENANKDLKGAAATLEEAVQKGIGDFRTHVMLARLYRLQGDFGRAESELRTASKLEPGSILVQIEKELLRDEISGSQGNARAGKK